MRFKTLIAAILALGIGLHALPAPARGGAPDVDIKTATATQLKALPGVNDTDSTKIIQSRPYSDKSQLVSKKVVSETTYDKIKDHIVARPKS